jgi:type I restriction enzyme M protein
MPPTQTEINNVLWRACDTFRGVVDPSDYKNYVLTMLFLKYVSDVWKEHKAEFEKRYPDDPEMVARQLKRERFILDEEASFDYLFERRGAENVGELIDIALAKIEDDNRGKLEGVFRNISFNSDNLGRTKDRNRRLKNLLEDFNNEKLDLRPSVISEDIIGNGYMYLIERFAAEAGKKGGEFYTPTSVSILLAKLVAPKAGDRICDPACGSCSLLIRVGDEVRDAKGKPSRDYSLFGQESNGSTWALGRMNLFLHEKDAADIRWADTINSPQLLEGAALMKFNVVVANPPFSLDKWGAEHAASDPFGRFVRGIPPKSKGDYAFILHMIETAMPREGRVGVIVPHGVLFRGGNEGKIRRALIEENLLDAVIGLPENLFFGTQIPAAILIFDRRREAGGSRAGESEVLFVNASFDFSTNKTQNCLDPGHISKIVDTFQARRAEPKYSALATREQLRSNDHNLNIPRYVDSYDEDGPIDISQLRSEIASLERELATVRDSLDARLRELGI